MAMPEGFAEALAESLKQSHQAMAQTFAGAFKNMKYQRASALKLSKFSGRPKKSGDPTLKEWSDDLNTYTRQLDLSNKEKLNVAIDHLGGDTKEEIRCCPEEEKNTIDKLITILRLRFGTKETVQTLNSAFYYRSQLEGESLEDYSRVLMRLYDRMELASTEEEEQEALAQLKQNALKEQLIRGTRDILTKRELRRLAHEGPKLPFFQFREQALKILRDVDDVCPPIPSDTTSLAIDKVSSGKPVSNDNKLLKGLIDSQKQLCSAMERIMQQQTETNSNIQKLSEAILNQKTGHDGPTRDNAQRRPRSQLQCSYCTKRGHTVDDCYKREYDRKKKANDSPKTEDRPSVQNLVADVHASENCAPPT